MAGLADPHLVDRMKEYNAGLVAAPSPEYYAGLVAAPTGYNASPVATLAPGYGACYGTAPAPEYNGGLLAAQTSGYNAGCCAAPAPEYNGGLLAAQTPGYNVGCGTAPAPEYNGGLLAAQTTGYNTGFVGTATAPATADLVGAAAYLSPAAPMQPRVGGGREQADLAEAVNVGQRASAYWKAAWMSYCYMYGTNVFEPAMHSREFLQGYLEFLGTQAALVLQVPLPNGAGYHGGSTGSSHRGGSGGGRSHRVVGGGGFWYTPTGEQASAQPAKRSSTGAGVGTDPALAALAEQVKQLQKSDPSRKQQWSDFCDINVGGVKDPLRHSLETLQLFLQQCSAS
uniref:Uncharacterized protein n=1 Tax=Alexandrium monilatum TaxID=311494 RepID=A0A7S4R4F1_9DINO